MKRILLVTRNFPPLIGGMEKLVFNIFLGLKADQNIEVSVAGPTASSKFHKLNRYVEFSVAPLSRFLLSSFLKTIKLSLKVKPHIVFCGSGATILAGYAASRLVNAKLVCYLHGLDIIADSVIYQSIFIPLIRRSDLILVNSQHSKLLALQAGMPEQRIKILSPGTFIPDLSKRESAGELFREKFAFKNNRLLLIAGRITKRKGIQEFIENVLPAIVLQFPDVKLVIAGEEASQAVKQSTGVKDSIVSTITNLGLRNHVVLIGGVSDELLSGAFCCSEMLVFPVLNLPNDVEGFGMIAIEAAAHGLPTIGFSVGGVPDAIGHRESGWLVTSGNYEDMLEIIVKKLSQDSSLGVSASSCVRFAEQHGWNFFNKKLINLLSDL